MTISVPDEVGAYLRSTGNASATVADLVANAIERAAATDLLERAGYRVTPEFVDEGVRIARDTPAIPPDTLGRTAEHRRARAEEGRRRRFSRSAADDGATGT
ncbi:MAG: hypothetical protein QOI74_1956 [Micromonosporaceae bacterium]|nr:hypothetical protein [Micromonosporaceae bacterium]MDT5036792.1 hypothetical protein [Micromonosporaceae bacterium]